MMTRSTRPLICATALGLLTLPGAAYADVMPDDVWANLGSYVATLGGVLTADISKDGSTANYDNITANFNLPLGSGTVTVTAGSMSMTPQGDGTVEIRHPHSEEISVGFVVHGEVSGNLTMTGTSASQVTIAAGDPGDISYDYTADSYDLTIDALQIEGMPDDLIQLSGNFLMSGVSAGARVTELDHLVSISGVSRYDGYEMTYSMVTPESSQNSTQSGTGLTSSYVIELPTGGMSVMNLAAALRDGLRFAGKSTVVSTRAVGTQHDALVGTINSDVSGGLQDMSVEFDVNGLTMLATAEEADITAELPEMLPFPISAQLGEVEFGFQMPLSAGEEPGDYGMLVSMTDLSVDESLWGMVDPTGTLPHDPASIRLDLSGKLGLLIDLLDIEAMDSAREAPFLLETMDLSSLLVSVAGAKLTGAGGFTFDNSDMVTFDGLPAPTGAVDLQLVGGNGLIDKLVTMGLLPQEQAMGARMMMGLFAQPGEGEDSLTSKIEIDGATGAISANGQRLQ